jgi:hypothetical protein
VDAQAAEDEGVVLGEDSVPDVDDFVDEVERFLREQGDNQ